MLTGAVRYQECSSSEEKLTSYLGMSAGAAGQPSNSRARSGQIEAPVYFEVSIWRLFFTENTFGTLLA